MPPSARDVQENHEDDDRSMPHNEEAEEAHQEVNIILCTNGSYHTILWYCCEDGRRGRGASKKAQQTVK
jgi:hypothetical protein